MIYPKLIDNKKEFSTKMIEVEEHLTANNLETLNVKYEQGEYSTLYPCLENRPLDNFSKLMDWVDDTFSFIMSDNKNTNKFVHNRIIIDGQFLQYCKEKNVEVRCLYKDSIISWKTDCDYEKFFAQGVFLIKNKDTEFLHAALWAKGNQFEDEVNFFVIVSESNLNKYLELRNDFNEWVKNRDRGNLAVRVIDGEDIPYVRDYTWDDLFLPEKMKKEIKNLVENFLISQDFYIEHKIPWKMGWILHGLPGCGKTTLIRILMSQYNFKPVTIAAGANDEAVREAFSYAEEQCPSLLYFEDLDSMLEKNDISNFLNLMDGISVKNGLLVIATTNEIRRLKPNITNRPSRFDRKFEFPCPTKEMAFSYLKKWFGSLISAEKCRSLAKCAEQNEFSYAYLKELYISSMFEALSNNRKTPTIADIDNSLKKIMADKNVVSKKVFNTEKYFE